MDTLEQARAERKYPPRVRSDHEKAHHRLRKLVSRGGTVYLSAPFNASNASNDDPWLIPFALGYVRQVVGQDAPVVVPERKATGGKVKGWGARKPTDPTGVLVVVPRPGMVLGRGSTTEFLWWKRAGRPVFVLEPDGLVAGGRYVARPFPEPERTGGHWAQLVRREAVSEGNVR